MRIKIRRKEKRKKSITFASEMEMKEEMALDK
jgi:hypothetical protein